MTIAQDLAALLSAPGLFAGIPPTAKNGVCVLQIMLETTGPILIERPHSPSWTGHDHIAMHAVLARLHTQVFPTLHQWGLQAPVLWASHPHAESAWRTGPTMILCATTDGVVYGTITGLHNGSTYVGRGIHNHFGLSHSPTPHPQDALAAWLAAPLAFAGPFGLHAFYGSPHVAFARDPEQAKLWRLGTPYVRPQPPAWMQDTSESAI